MTLDWMGIYCIVLASWFIFNALDADNWEWYQRVAMFCLIGLPWLRVWGIL